MERTLVVSLEGLRDFCNFPVKSIGSPLHVPLGCQLFLGADGCREDVDKVRYPEPKRHSPSNGEENKKPPHQDMRLPIVRHGSHFVRKDDACNTAAQRCH